MSWPRRMGVAGIALAASCAASPPPPPERPRPAPAAEPAPVTTVARPRPAREPTRPADPERVAELERRLREDPGRGARAPAPPPPPADEGGPELARLDLDGLVEALGAAVREADAAGEPPPGASPQALRARDQELSGLERRLRAIAYRLQLRQDERVRDWELEWAQADAPLADEEGRLSRRSAAVVVGPDRAYVDSPDEELEQVRAERLALRAALDQRVAALREAYRPMLERAGRARLDVGALRRGVQRRLSGE